MSTETKIWFVYLSDHHEGPFTPEEVAEKVKQGVVNAQSLGWKDGMAEWVPLESIPELKSALDGGGAAGAAGAPGDDGFSLAQMLASQQQGTPAAGDNAGEASEFTGATSVLSSMVQSAMSNNPTDAGSISIGLDAEPGAATAQAKGAAPVGPDEEVWT